MKFVGFLLYALVESGNPFFWVFLILLLTVVFILAMRDKRKRKSKFRSAVRENEEVSNASIIGNQVSPQLPNNSSSMQLPVQLDKKQSNEMSKPALGENIYVDIPPSISKYAHLLGATFDNRRSLWRLVNNQQSRYIVTGELFILQRTRRCHRCGKMTPVIAFALKGFNYLTETGTITVKSANSRLRLLSDISPMPHSLRDALAKRFVTVQHLGCNA